MTALFICLVVLFGAVSFISYFRGPSLLFTPSVLIVLFLTMAYLLVV